MNPVIEKLKLDIAGRLAEAEHLFKAGVKLTFIARRPDDPEQDVLVTNDSIEGIREAIERAAARDTL